MWKVAVKLRCVSVALTFLGHPDFLAFGDYYITLLTGIPAEMFISPPGDLGWGVVGFRGRIPKRWGRGTCIRGWNVLLHEVGDCICRTGGLPRDIGAAGFEPSWLHRCMFSVWHFYILAGTVGFFMGLCWRFL